MFGSTLAWAVLSDGPVDPSGDSEIGGNLAPDRGDPAMEPDDPVPGPLVAAEHFVAEPGADRLRALVEAIGGIDSIVVGQAEGTFDLVRFDPLDPDRLLASARSSYGKAENQGVNEYWDIGADGLTQTLFAAETPHDFAHFNGDGTITMWVKAEAGESFAPRRATVTDRSRQATEASEPLFASRFTTANGTTFALTGDGDYYSRSDTYEQLVADGETHAVLDSGELYEWIDNPVPGLLIAYPRDQRGTTAVWSTVPLEPMPDHPLANRPVPAARCQRRPTYSGRCDLRW